MIDLKNEFRFYPDLNIQQAITGVEVYYFVMNDVYKHHLVKREGGRYWNVSLREFSLGESIQRVEVIVDCSIIELNKSLKTFGIAAGKDDLTPYLFLRRGDDRALVKLGAFYKLKNAADLGFQQIIKNEDETQSAIAEMKFQVAKKLSLFKKLSDPTTVKKLSKLELDSLKQEVNSSLKDSSSIAEIDRARSVMEQNFSQLQSDLQRIQPLTLSLNDSQLDKEYELIKQASSNPENRYYTAYVENRLSSMLDIRLKPEDPSTIQFNYRNDKLSLQYLQADDPQEKLGIFRARLVPFAFYSSKLTDPDRYSEFVWQRGKVIYEVGINFGYAIVKGDNFTPKFFDMNRLGVALGITADTFTDHPSFLTAALSYDVNTYTSISFGANLIDKPMFYMGIGINARAFKDLVKSSAALFKGTN